MIGCMLCLGVSRTPVAESLESVRDGFDALLAG